MVADIAECRNRSCGFNLSRGRGKQRSRGHQGDGQGCFQKVHAKAARTFFVLLVRIDAERRLPQPKQICTKRLNTVATLRRLPRRMLRKCDAFPRLVSGFANLSLQEHPLRRGGLTLGRLVGESQLDAACTGAERQQLLL